MLFCRAVAIALFYSFLDNGDRIMIKVRNRFHNTDYTIRLSDYSSLDDVLYYAQFGGHKSAKQIVARMARKLCPHNRRGCGCHHMDEAVEDTQGENCV